MNILCWNCRGLGNPWTVCQLRRWVSSLTPDILFLSETKISNQASERVKDRIDFSNAIGVASIGLSGALCIMWNNETISFTLTSYSQNHISGEVIVRVESSGDLLGYTGGRKRQINTKLGIFFGPYVAPLTSQWFLGGTLMSYWLMEKKKVGQIEIGVVWRASGV